MKSFAEVQVIRSMRRYSNTRPCATQDSGKVLISRVTGELLFEAIHLDGYRTSQALSLPPTCVSTVQNCTELRLE